MIITEFMENGSLDTFLKVSPPLSPSPLLPLCFVSLSLWSMRVCVRASLWSLRRFAAGRHTKTHKGGVVPVGGGSQPVQERSPTPLPEGSAVQRGALHGNKQPSSRSHVGVEGKINEGESERFPL